ncbi:hypothetical protein J3R30DRAFT_3710658 [Lentinula aciculospora]|uniref:F-box domain-containing protein n=1 Tax=Lentinula aciculospora TaxID=153920 RepID=A0A9W8ZZD2_9AGAR|nr:hypothetical protein J3R30DRAFT_3710658 [Lentinula aciculospora]
MSVKFSWSLQLPYASFLYTNYAASPTERLELNAFLFEPRQELSRLESEISHIRALLDDLLTQHNQAKAFVDAHFALTDPIRRLPTGTLVEIFASLLLTMVCRGWRDIAINLPPIWSSLQIYAKSRTMLERWQQGISGWIARAGALPLVVSLSFQGIGMAFGERISSFMQTLMKFSPRLKEVVLNLDAELFPLLESVSPQSFPLLENFSISVPRSNFLIQFTKIPFIRNLAAGMPMLQKLSINGFSEGQHFRSTLKWTNITELVLESTHHSTGLPLEHILGILAQTIKL